MTDLAVSRKDSSWRQAGVCLGLLIAAILFAYWDTAVSMVGVWSSSATFNHGFFMPLISIWLIWGRRDALRRLTPQTSLLGLAGILGASLLWLAGEVASVQVVQHFALVFSIQFAVLAVWGWPAVRLLLFPLGYLLFAVPFGEFLTVHLQDFTAAFVVGALRMLDIPVFSDGIFISIPTGNFKVAEACAGLRFLIATLAVGTLFAYLSYKTARRRLIFVAASFVVPVIANGFRALGIVLIAYYTNNEYAVGIDHIVYGWGFFAAILLVLLAVGSRFADKPLKQDELDMPSGDDDRPVRGLPIALAAALGLVMIAVGPAYAQFIVLRGAENHVDLRFVERAGEWEALEAGDNRLGWAPEFVGASDNHQRTYIRDDGQVISLYAAVYDSQSQEAELINAANDLTTGTRNWDRASTRSTDLRGIGRVGRLRLTTLRDSAMVFYVYWVDGRFVVSPMEAKLRYVRAALLGGELASGVLAIATPLVVDEQQTEALVEDFLSAMPPMSMIFTDDMPPEAP